MYSAGLLKPFAVIASSVCVIEASAWTVLALLAILVNTCGIYLSTDDSFRYVLGNYIQGDECKNPDIAVYSGLLTPKDILIVLCFYFVTSFFWLVSSGILLSAFLQGELKNQLNIIYCWIGTTAVTCLLDFVMTIMFGLDYNKIMASEDNIQFPKVLLLPVTATVMTLAAKGFVLWIFNMSFLIYFSRVAYYLREEQMYNNGHALSRQPSLRSLGYHPPQAVNNVDRKRMEQMWRNEPNHVQSPTIGSEHRMPWPVPQQYPQTFGSVHGQGPREEPQQYGQQNVPQPSRQYPDPSRGPWITPNRPPSVQNEYASRPPPMSRSMVALPRVPIAVPPPQLPQSFPRPDYSPEQQHKKYEPRMFDQPQKSAMRRQPAVLPPNGRTLL